MPGDPFYTSTSWRRIRKLILDRDEHRCQIQGPHCTKRATHVDHIIPRGIGGPPLDPANLRAACAKCNLELSHLGRLDMTPTLPPSRPW